MKSFYKYKEFTLLRNILRALCSLFIFSSISVIVHADLINNQLDKYQFIENKGQFVDQNGNQVTDILFIAKNGLKSVYIRNNGITFVDLETTTEENIFSAKRQNMDFAAHNGNTKITGLDKSPDHINYYLPHCPQGILNVRKYAIIEYENLYDNIDFQIYINSDGKLQYDFIVNPGGNPEDICFRMTNTDKLVLQKGDLIVRSADDEIVHQSPITYQIIDNKRQIIRSGFKILSHNSVGFDISDYNKSKKLVIDPVIREWGTFYGGHLDDELRCVMYDSNGNIICCGYTDSAYNIATSSAYQNNLNGTKDAMIIKLDNSGKRIWSTYYGGSEIDMGAYLAIDNADNIFISGSTLSDDVIGDGGYQPSNNGSYDCFLAKFDQSGHRIWGTFYGGNNNDNPFLQTNVTYGDIALDSQANIYLSGITYSENVIGEGGWQPSIGSEDIYDCFLAKFDSTGKRVWGTYYGGNGNDWLYGLELDHEENIIIGGSTQSIFTFASEDAWQVFEVSLGLPAFLSKFDKETGNRIWGTYFFEENYITSMRDIDVDSDGNIYFLAITNAKNLGIGKYKNKLSGSRDYLLGKFSNNGKPIWTSYIGGSSWDFPTSIHVSDNTHLYAAGITESNDFPVRAAFQKEMNGWRDNVLMKYDTNGRYIWGTYYGGESEVEDYMNDILWDIEANENDQIVMCGHTCSEDVFGNGGFQPEYGGGVIDSWIAFFQNFDFTIGEPTPYSICPGAEITIPFYLENALEDDQIFEALIWMANGDYFDAISIGSKTTKNSGTLNAIIPMHLTPGKYNVTIAGADNYYPITVFPIPQPEITGPKHICSKYIQTYSCNLQDDFKYKWESKHGEIQGRDDLKNLQINWVESGIDTLTLTVTNNTTGCSNSTTFEVQIDIWETEIHGKRLVCYGDYLQKYFNNIKGLQKRWEVQGGEITEGQDSDTITVEWSSGGVNKVSLILKNPKGNCRDTLKINVVVDEQPVPEPIINGRVAVCPNEIQTYYVNTDHTENSFLWEVRGGEIQGSNNQSTVSVLWSEEVEAYISVVESTPAGCSGSDHKQVYINCYGADIFGSVDVCVGGVYMYRTQHIPGTTNLWTAKPGGNVISPRMLDSVLVKWSQTGTKLIALTKLTQTQHNNCTRALSRLVENASELSVFDIPEIEYDPKEQFDKTIKIPIVIEKPGCLSYIGDPVSVTIELSIRKSMFLPITTSNLTYEDDETNTWRTITLHAPVFNPLDSDTLIQIEGYALLGDTLVTPIKIESMQWSGISVNEFTKQGSLRAINVTEIGGRRLLKKKQLDLMKIYPIPFSNELNLLIESQKRTDAFFEIYSVLGKKVYSENISLRSGVQEVMIKLKNKLSDGVYKIVLKNIDAMVSENVIIRN